TGADIASSVDETGSSDLGGDWELETSTGEVESDVVIGDLAQQNWQGLLAPNEAPTFGTIGDGIVTTAIGSGNDRGYSVTVQSDGKILVAGYSDNGTDNDFTLVRYNANGSLDTTFDGDGIVTTDFGSGNDNARSVTVQSDGKILMAGYSDNGGDNDIIVVRYNTDGSLDTSFGSNGVVTTSVQANTNDIASAIAVQNDGKIVVAGGSQGAGTWDLVLLRYTSNGTLDTTFNGDGIVRQDVIGTWDGVNGLAVQSDGKIVASGGYAQSFGVNRNFITLRYNPDGSLDTTFSGDGWVGTEFSTNHDTANGTVLQPDGKILAVGYNHNGSDYEFALTRYNADGSLDTSFDGDGMLTTDLGSGNDQGRSVTVQSDGKILVAGESNNGTDNDFTLVRYNADGSLDTTFDTVSTLNGTPAFTEGGAAVVLDADVDVSDVELDALDNYDGASLTLIRNGGAN
ncbi:MAG: DUF4347 domain-containing protein, partial [Halieaceae bacterium]|nr:DUF4347 domain-containing protein [Halieaceae bacterium]